MTPVEQFTHYYRSPDSPFRFMVHADDDEVIREWTDFYIPPPSVPKEGLIVDVGARDGDSALFYVVLGYKNLRLVEPWHQYWENLEHNVELLRKMGATVEVTHEPYKPEHLQGVAFVKFDCEGCEKRVDLTQLKVPAVAEIHIEPRMVEGEVEVFNYAPRIGYLKWFPS